MAKNSQLLVEIGPGISLIMGLPTIAYWTTQERPKRPQAGTIGFNTTSLSVEYFDGINWLASKLKKDQI